jgi:hypothetical protein
MMKVETFGPPQGLPQVRYTDYYDGVERAPCTLTVPRELLTTFLRYGMRVGVTHSALAALALYEYLEQHDSHSVQDLRQLLSEAEGDEP